MQTDMRLNFSADVVHAVLVEVVTQGGWPGGVPSGVLTCKLGYLCRIDVGVGIVGGRSRSGDGGRGGCSRGRRGCGRGTEQAVE